MEENTAASGATETPVVNQSDESKQQIPEVLTKLKKEKENWKTKALELEAKFKESEEAKLAETNQYKKLYESKVESEKRLSEEIQSFKKTLVDKSIEESIRAEFEKVGVDNKWFKDALLHVDKSIISYDQETGLVIGADAAVKSFAEKYSQLGFFKKAPVGVNHAAPVGGGQKKLEDMTIQEKFEFLSKMKG